MNSHSFYFLLLLGLASCQTATTSSPLSEGQGGASGGSGDASGAAGEFGTGGNSGASAGNSGTGGSNGAEDPATLCEGACIRLTTCAGPPTFSVDIPACVAHCIKEVSGQGALIQEIAIDFYAGMKDSPEGCSFPRQTLSAYWTKFDDAKELGKLKEPQVLQTCVDALWECYQGDKSEYGSGCFQDHYRYNTEMREKDNACFKQKCPDRYYCWSGLAPNTQIWLDGITENVK